MRRVLRRLEFCNENRVLFKGRVACLISTGDELLTTELLFNATFNQLDTEVMVALLSCLVNEENSDKAYPTTPELIASY